MLVDKVKKFYDKKYDLNCAETILYAADEEYSLNLSKDAFKSLAGFGGGIGVENICGAITGAISVIGIMFTDKTAHKSPIVKKLSIDFMNNFKCKLKEYNCDKLKEKYRKNDNDRCLYMVEIAGEVLEDIIIKEKIENR